MPNQSHQKFITSCRRQLFAGSIQIDEFSSNRDQRRWIICSYATRRSFGFMCIHIGVSVWHTRLCTRCLWAFRRTFEWSTTDTGKLNNRKKKFSCQKIKNENSFLFFLFSRPFERLLVILSELITTTGQRISLNLAKINWPFWAIWQFHHPTMLDVYVCAGQPVDHNWNWK